MRFKDREWNCSDRDPPGYEAAHLAVMMDIRDELKRLNLLLHCYNFTQIPGVLRSIRRNTAKPRPPRRAKAKA